MGDGASYADVEARLRLSRRIFLTGAAALPVLGGAAYAQTPPPVTPVVPTPEPELDEATLAAQTDYFQLMRVDVRINNQGPFRFVVDTGSERTVIADNVAAALGLKPLGRVKVDGVVRSVQADLVSVADLSVGPFTRSNLELPVLPRVHLLADGFLGLDAIRGSRVTFDFKHEQLRIEKPRLNKSPFEDNRGQTIVVRASGAAGRLRATNCSIDGVRATMFVDTGAQTSMGNPALLEALARKPAGITDVGDIGIQGVTGGQTTGRLISVKTIRLQNLLFASGVIAISNLDIFKDWGLEGKPAMMLGMNFLRQFGGVSIDYRTREIMFDMSGTPSTGPTLM